MTKNADMPATGHAGPIAENDFADAPGLTKREMFAAMAMQGLVAHKSIPTKGRLAGDTHPVCAEMAIRCVVMADALLAELERTA